MLLLLPNTFSEPFSAQHSVDYIPRIYDSSADTRTYTSRDTIKRLQLILGFLK